MEENVVSENAAPGDVDQINTSNEASAAQEAHTDSGKPVPAGDKPVPAVSANTRAAIEAMLFASDKPLMLDQIRKILDNLDAASIRSTVEGLQKDYEESNRGIRIYEVAGGYQMIANPIFAIFLKKLFKTGRNTDRLSKSAMETLAIIAYKQPLSKLEIESLRQVNVDGVMSTLEEKDLIRVTGRKKTPGRPKVYGTTRKFLEYFGLKSLEDLPKLENVHVPTAQQLEDIEPVKEQTETAQGQENNVTPTSSQTN
ncbi:MAG: SMC-Scp complex subunit ScpB [Candidatus Omnitrophota bacterium]